jgi:cyclophilin family peptidyl-prolyl cis-trans isomerase
MRRTTALAVLASLLLSSLAAAQAQESPKVRVQTTLGSFVIALDAERAPLTVKSFLEYVRAGHYNGTIFHRVIGNFVAQAGGYDEKYVERATRPGIPNESGNGLSNRRGTIGMARTGDPHSSTAQFYVNLADNAALDPQPSRWGYAVFGHVVEGMNVLDDIGAVPTGEVGPFDRDAPLKAVVIQKIEEIR